MGEPQVDPLRQPVLIAALLVACAPPPEVEGSEPRITIAYPDIDGTQVPLQCLPNPEFVCGESDPVDVRPYGELLGLTVVVDIDNLELTDPYAEGVEVVDGQGHWHVHLDNESVVSSFTRIAEVVAEVDTGHTVILDVTLRDNVHELLGPRDTIEFEVTPSGQSCEALPEDFCP